MKLSRKINLSIAAWLLSIMIVVCTTVYLLFTSMSYNMEIHAMTNTLEQMMDNHAYTKDLQLKRSKLSAYMTRHSFFRIVQPDGTVRDIYANNGHIPERIPAKFVTQKNSAHATIEEEQYITVRLPIKQGSKVVGTIEYAERFTGMETRKDLLLTMLITITALSVLMSLVAGRSLSRLILRPIRALIGTMEDIEKSAKPQHIDPPQSRDELNQLALTFNAMITKLQASIDLQKQFVSDASHELRTPLTVIASFTEILRKRGVDNPALTQEALEAIASESSRMEQMTTQLLALARSESPVLAELESVDFVDCSRKVVANLQQATGRDIHLDAPAAPVHIRASQASVIQLLLILLDNAIKYSQLPIAVRVARVDKQLVLTVRDEGVGIPAADLPFIFDRFYRVDKARSRATGGTGLGLAIAKNIVTTYNGTIQITSENEKWTCVEVRFATID